MKHRRWTGILLALVIAMGPAAPAYAEGEPSELPPPAAAESGELPAAEQPLLEDVPAPIDGVQPSDVAEDIFQNVTVELTGAVDTIHQVIYQGTEDLVYFTDSTGTYYNRLDSAGSNETVYVVRTDTIPTRLTAIADGNERALMGFDLRIFLDNESDVTVKGATVKANEMDTGARCVDILLPDSGNVSIDVAAYCGAVPTVIPFTFYNEDWDSGIIVGGGSVADGSMAGEPYAYPEDGTVTTGGCFEVWTGPGYAIEVLEGGSIAETRAPSGAAAASVPGGSTCYVLQVDLGAGQFTIAAVKEGEHYVPGEDITPAEPETPAEPDAPADDGFTMPTGGVPVAVSGPLEPVKSISLWAPGDGIYDHLYNLMPDGVYHADSSGEWVRASTSRPTQFDVYPGTEMRFKLDPAYTLSVTGAETGENLFYGTLDDGTMGVEERIIYAYAPESGSVQVRIVPYDGAVVKQIPLTEYNPGGNSEGFLCSNIQKGIEAITYWDENGTAHGYTVSGTVLCFQLRAGWTIQVLEGGRIIRTGSWLGPGREANSIGIDIQADDDAEAFSFAIVKEGEIFTPPEEHTATGTFKDVPDDSWYKDVVESAYAAGVVTGTSADTFSPNATASRAQTVTMLWRQAGSPQADDSSFTDLSADWYRDAVDWASWVGAVNGTSDASFVPNGIITREQLAAALYRLAGSPTAYSGGLLDNYTDGDTVSSYARTAMQWALDYGIIKGYDDGTVRPSKSATRAEICAMLMRYAELVGRFPTEPAAAPTPEPTEKPPVQGNILPGVNTNNPRLIPPKRTAYSPDVESGTLEFWQEYIERYWDLDRSGEDLVWCTEPNVRLLAGPDGSCSQIYTVDCGDELSRLGPDENGWTPVTYHQYWFLYGFTGVDYTGYIPTDVLTETKPKKTTVVPLDSAEACMEWMQLGWDEYPNYVPPVVDREDDPVSMEYEPTISGTDLIYTIRGGGTVTIHNADASAILSFGTGDYEADNTLDIVIDVKSGYGLLGTERFTIGPYISTNNPFPMRDNENRGAWLNYIMKRVYKGEDLELTMVSGDAAPHLLQVLLKDNVGGSRMGDGQCAVSILDENGNWPADQMTNFFNIKGGYKLRSLSPYVTIGKIDNEFQYFQVQNVPRDVRQVQVEVVWG